MTALETARTAFVERRRAAIGGSDVAAILGFSKWSDAIQVYLRKRGLVEDDDTSVMERGRYREDALIRWYRDTKGVRRLIGPAEQRSGTDGYYQHAGFPWLCANIDEVVRGAYGAEDDHEWIVDAKVSFSRGADYGEEGTDHVPDDAFWQGLHYCFVLDMPKVDFIVERLGNWPPKIYTVMADDDLYRMMLPDLERFWFEHVLPGVPPPPNFARPEVIEAIKALYPSRAIEKKTIQLPESLTVETSGKTVAVSTLAVVEMVEFLKDRQKADRAVQDRLDALLRHYLKDAQVGEIEGPSGTVNVKRTYNKGGARPATVVKPYDYLLLNWPKGHVHELAPEELLRRLEGETNE